MANKEDTYREMVDNQVVKVDFTEPPKKQKKEGFVTRIVYAVITLLVGVVFIIARDHIFDVLGYIVGGLLLIMGAVTITAFFTSKGNKWVGSLVWGILEAILGVFCLFTPHMIANFAVYIFAIIIFISGIVMSYFAVRDKKAGFGQWLPSLIFGIVLAVIGLVMLLFVNQTKAFVAVMVGIAFLITAVLNVITLFLK